MKRPVSIKIKNLAMGLTLLTCFNSIGWSQGDAYPIDQSNSSSHGLLAALQIP
jgi:hypothetical protein